MGGKRRNEMKRIKRIIAVVILCVVVLLVGYSCYTGSRLTSYPQNLDGYKNKTFYTNDGGMVAFTDEYAWYQAGGQDVILLKIKSYEQGVILMMKDDKEYAFTAVDNDTIYDEQTKEILTKGARYG